MAGRSPAPSGARSVHAQNIPPTPHAATTTTHKARRRRRRANGRADMKRLRKTCAKSLDAAAQRKEMQIATHACALSDPVVSSSHAFLYRNGHTFAMCHSLGSIYDSYD